MNIITTPTVEVCYRQQADHAAIERFVGEPWRSDSDIAAQSAVELGGRTCYWSFRRPRPGGNRTHVARLIESGHGSCLHHATWMIGVRGVSRSFSHELNRHSVGFSPSELSQRYVDCTDVAFVVPPAIEKYHAAWMRHRDWLKEAHLIGNDTPDFSGIVAATRFQDWIERRNANIEEYEDWTMRLLADAPSDLDGTERRKWARQAARNCLPNCTETRLVISANARAIRNVLEQRGSRHADAEIRRFANVLYDIMLIEAPAIFADYEVTKLYDGTRELHTKNRKV